MPKVVIFQYRLFHYRIELFNQMRALAAERGIDVVVVAGQAFGKEILKRDEGTLGWECRVKSHYFPIDEKKDLCWQPWPKQHRDADLLCSCRRTCWRCGGSSDAGSASAPPSPIGVRQGLPPGRLVASAKPRSAGDPLGRWWLPTRRSL
jgi:hypothetical protein